MSSRTEEIVINPKDKTKLFVRTWHPPSKPVATILIVHGYLEHGGRYREFGEHLCSEYGISTVAYDLRGHGKSSGQRAYCWSINDYFTDLETVLGHAKAKNEEADPNAPVPVFILAHSFGGLQFLDYARDKPDVGVAGAIISCPFVDYADRLDSVKIFLSRLLGSLCPRLSFPAEELTGSVLTHDPIKQKEHDDDPQNLHIFTVGWALETLKAQVRVRETFPIPLSMPVLYLQAEQDKVSHPEAVDRVGKNIEQKDKTIVERKGEFHELLNEVNRRETYKIVADWVVQRAK